MSRYNRFKKWAKEKRGYIHEADILWLFKLFEEEEAESRDLDVIKGFKIDLTEMVFKGVPLEKAEEKELLDIESISTYKIDYWERSKFIHNKIEELLNIKQNQLIPMYLKGEIKGGVRVGRD